MSDMPTGVELIAAERQRQVEVEGWSHKHDDEHRDQSLAWAATCYAAPAEIKAEVKINCGCQAVVEWRDPWPWASCYDRRSGLPPNRIRELVKAGALIAAEIDRLQRADFATNQQPKSADHD